MTISAAPISATPISANLSTASVRSFTITPNAVYTGMAAHTLNLAGVGTNWMTGPATFTVSAGATKISQNITSDTSATIVVTTGGTPATITVDDGSGGVGATQTFSVGAASISRSPTTIYTSTTGNVITLTGANTLWTIDAPTFSLSGGTGASITAQSITGNNSATVTVTAGSAPATLTITDPISGASTTIAASAPASTTKVLTLLSPFLSTDPAPAGYQLKKFTGGALVNDGSRGTSVIAITGVTNGYTAAATATLDGDGGYRGIVLWDTGGGSPIYVADEVYIPPAPTGGGAPSGGSGGITITLVDSAGNPRANLTGLRWAWFDQSRPDLFSTPAETGSGEVTNASGVLTIALSNTVLTSGQIGFLVVSDTDGSTSMTHKAFSGPVALT